MSNQKEMTSSKEYFMLSIIGQYSTLLLIADRLDFDSTGSILINILFFESIIMYAAYFIYLSRRNPDFLTGFFNRVFKSDKSRLKKLRDLLFIILFAISFIIPADTWIYFQYAIVPIAILILIYGLIKDPSSSDI